MESSPFSRIHPRWLVVAVLAGLIVTVAVMSSTVLSEGPITLASAPGGIEGVLYEPNGATVVAGGWIDIHDAEGQPWMGTDTDAGGYFAIPNLPPGDYILNAYPPEGSDYASSLPAGVEVLSGEWAATSLLLTEVRISGWVQDSETGSRIQEASVVAHDDEWTVEQWSGTNANGEYKIGGVHIGVTYTLEALPPPDSPYVQLPFHYTAVPITDAVVLEMRVPPTNVVGIVHDPEGAPVPGAGVVVSHDEYWAETAADELGGFLFGALPPGEFWLHAAPPWGVQGLIASEPFTLVITCTESSLVDVGIITLPHAYKTVRGQVLFEGTSDGVADAMPTAHRLDGPGYADTPTDASGAFTMSLSGGEWHVAVEPLNPGAEWIFPGPPAWVVFETNTTLQTETVVLEVIPTNAWVTGQVVCPGGNPCPDDPPPDAIRVELRSGDIGNQAGLGPDYRFAVPIPDGWYELVAHVHDPRMQGPGPVPVFVGPNEAIDVGNVELLLRDARIIGQVRNEFGLGVPGVYLAGWQPEGCGWSDIETDGSGYYTVPVIGGEWFVEPHPGPDLPYVFRHGPQLVHVEPGGSVTGVNFGLTNAESRIQGIAVDANTQERAWGLEGWAFAERHVAGAEPEFFSDAPMGDGGFELKVAGGHQYYVGVELPPHAPYVSGGVGPISVTVGELVTAVIALEPKDAVIEGRLIDATSAVTPTLPIWAEIFGHDERGHWVSVGVDPDSGTYELGVVSGTWHLRTWVDVDSGYVAEPTATPVTVESGQGVIQDFQVWPIGAHITGRVLQPNGTPMTMTFVFAGGESPFVGYSEAGGETDESGDFDLAVPEGEYVVGAGLPGDELAARGWLNPPPIEGVATTVITPATGLVLRYRQLDGVIAGTVSFASGDSIISPTHPAYVWGWAESGEWAETEAGVVSGTNTFTYALRVVSDTVWHVGAVYEDWDNGQFYESSEEVVTVGSSTGQATQDLTLAGPYTLPQPLIVSFDGTQMQTIVLPDGVELSIPPGALVVSGTVTLFIFPTQELRPEEGQEVIGVGYEIWATDQNGQEIGQFNKNVVMTFYYPPDATLVSQGISEYKLVPMYYSTLVGHWILADSYVVDTANNEITCHMSHFSKFGVSSTEARQYPLYLPLVLRNGS